MFDAKKTKDEVVSWIRKFFEENGVAVIFVGEDLDVLLELCDRILVVSSGKVAGIVDGRTATKEEIGLLMTKSSHNTVNEEEEK